MLPPRTRLVCMHHQLHTQRAQHPHACTASTCTYGACLYLACLNYLSMGLCIHTYPPPHSQTHTHTLARAHPRTCALTWVQQHWRVLCLPRLCKFATSTRVLTLQLLLVEVNANSCLHHRVHSPSQERAARACAGYRGCLLRLWAWETRHTQLRGAGSHSHTAPSPTSGGGPCWPCHRTCGCGRAWVWVWACMCGVGVGVGVRECGCGRACVQM